MTRSTSQNSEDMLNITALELFIKDRENSLSQNVDSVSVSDIYASSLKPLLGKCTNSPSLSNIQERSDFMGELLALWIYSKKHTVNSWEYEPKLPNGKTPDFLLNDSVCVEVYSPLDDLPKSVIGRMASDSRTGVVTTGFFPSGSTFDKTSITKKIEEKSAKYHDMPITILVVTYASGFVEDVVRACDRAEIEDTHSVEYYHGSKRFYPTEKKK